MSMKRPTEPEMLSGNFAVTLSHEWRGHKAGAGIVVAPNLAHWLVVVKGFGRITSRDIHGWNQLAPGDKDASDDKGKDKGTADS